MPSGYTARFDLQARESRLVSIIDKKSLQRFPDEYGQRRLKPVR